MRKISIEAARAVIAQLKQAEGRAARSAIRREACELYGISDSTLSRWLHGAGHQERERADRGVRRIAVPEETLRGVAALVRGSNSLKKGPIMPAVGMVQIAEDNGFVEPGVLKPSYLNRFMRENGFSKRHQMRPEPHITMRSKWPNHVHQVDFSLAVNWKIFQGRPVYEHLVYKNKLPEGGVPRLWRLIVVDHCSGAFFPWYVESTGETVKATLEGLYRAWARKTLRGESIENRYPFRGVPQILMADRGSANQAKITEVVMARLGVDFRIVQGARAKGTVEVSHNIWEMQFESRMRYQTPQSVEQLNEWAVDYAAWFCAAIPHSRFRATRSAHWAWRMKQLGDAPLRELNCSFETFKAIAVNEPTIARVRGDKTIQFKGKVYRLPGEVSIFSRVEISYSAFEYPNVLVRPVEQPNAAPWLCEPLEFDQSGFPVNAPVIGEEFKSHKQTETQQFMQSADLVAAQHIESQGLKIYGHHAEKVEPLQVRPEGTELLLPGAGQAARMPKFDARLRVIEMIGRGLTGAEIAYVNSAFGEGVTEAEIDAAVAVIERGVAAAVLTFPQAVGGKQ